MGYRLGIDTGGTFTDVALINEETGNLFASKVPSTPHNPSEAIINGLEKIMRENNIKENDNIKVFIHGTTVATNSLLERKGAKTALITTKGFKDVLEIGRQTRPKLYDFKARRIKPLIDRYLRVEIEERIKADGTIEKPINKEVILSIIDELKRQNVQSVAVCLLNAYRNNEHELIIKKIIQKEWPEVYISISSEVLPEFREYERTSTNVINAYVMPKMKSYLEYLEKKLIEKNITSDLYIMQSNGGIIHMDTATTTPARTVLSGPAGGAMAGITISEMTKRNNIITIDMGGTSLDTCLIENKHPHYTTLSEIGGMPIKLPMIEMHTIGSGGGSIASIDSGGALKVGPESAGANPGPICYGKGGIEPTVTDANAILGRLNPEFILGGEMKMDLETAKWIVKEKIADPLGMSVEEAAEGILRVVNANMVRGIHVVSVEKGYDPRDFSLVAFGGAGPVNAIDIAMELNCREVIIPKFPGVNCAIGMLSSDIKQDYVQTYLKSVETIKYSEITHIFNELETKAMQDLNSGNNKNTLQFIKSVDLRFIGQSYELTIQLDDELINKKTIQSCIQRFYNQYEKLYGYSDKNEEIEIVNLRLVAVNEIEKVEFKENSSTLKNEPKPISIRKVYFNGEYMHTEVYSRDSLTHGSEVKGPAVIEQLDSTILVYPNQIAITDSFDNLIIKLD